MSLDEKKIIRRIQDELAGNPAWQVFLGSDWICPYCGRIGLRGVSQDMDVELLVLRHLRSDCTSWKAFTGKLKPVDELKQQAQRLAVQGRLEALAARDERYRAHDAKGRWICPYCLAANPLGKGEATEAMARHLSRCPRFAEGREKALASAVDVAEAVEQANLRIRLKRVKKRILSDPRWQLKDSQGRWLCPFCATFPGQTLKMPPQERDARLLAEHIAVCTEAHDLSGPERDLSSLKAILQREVRRQSIHILRKKIKKYPLWLQRDLEVIWFCPYCARKTGIYFPEAAVDDGETLSEVLKHLEGCPAYGQGKVQDLSVVQKAVEESNQLVKLKREIRRSLSTDSRFTVANIMGAWCCPYCRAVVPSIDLPKGAESVELPPVAEKIAVHLLYSCEGYGKRDPLATADLSSIADGRLPPSGRSGELTPVQKSMPSIDETVLASLGREVAELKTFLKTEREGLEDARNKQRRLLPKMPEIDGYEFGYYYEPCEVLGGDFYDFFKARSALGIAIGDISGHGLGAGLLMGLAKKLLEIHGRDHTSPKETLCRANRDIFPDLDAKTFVTVFYSVLDPKKRSLRMARAGHNPLVLYNPKRDPVLQTLEPQGMALGMDPGKLFEPALEETSVQLVPGDLVFQYTDGVTECQNSAKEEWGTERLHTVIREFGQEEAEYVIFKVVKALEAFCGGLHPKDDITMLAFKVL